MSDVIQASRLEINRDVRKLQLSKHEQSVPDTIRMKDQKAKLISVSIGTGGDMAKHVREYVMADLEGFVDDRHRGFSRVCYDGDTEPAGTVRRNNRQWSGMSQEEAREIQEALNLDQRLLPGDFGVNVFVEGIKDFSKLPKGSKLAFPSGAVLVVEDFNPPCTHIADKIVSLYRTRSGTLLTRRQFLIEAKRKRGVVGVVDVPGKICSGDLIDVKRYKSPKLG